MVTQDFLEYQVTLVSAVCLDIQDIVVYQVIPAFVGFQVIVVFVACQAIQDTQEVG